MVIEHAKGRIAAQHAVSVEEAFELLRRHARGNNRKIAEVAEAVVTLGLRLPETLDKPPAP